MNPLEEYIVELLQNKVNNKYNVEVVKNYSQNPRTPTITLDISGGINTLNYKHIFNKQEYIIYHRKTSININVWCNTEDQRQQINNRIQELFNMEQSNHYQYCTNYEEDGYCKTINTKCQAISNPTNYMSCKNKCPNPITNQYNPLRNKHNLIHDTIIIEPALDLDELDENPPLLRSIHKAEAEYYDTIKVGGQQIEKIEYK